MPFKIRVKLQFSGLVFEFRVRANQRRLAQAKLPTNQTKISYLNFDLKCFRDQH